MFDFYGQERCKIDGNNRIKLSSVFLSSFERISPSMEIVLFCLPEHAIGIYPVEVWEQMRQEESEDREASMRMLSESMLSRRQRRRFGSMTQFVSISRQGRVTLPATFMEFAGIAAKDQVVLAGVEVGLELWSEEAWDRELAVIQDHLMKKSKHELETDLEQKREN